MIVKVPPARKDGGSSFEDLEAYITEGIEQSGDSTDKGSWDRLTQYITKDSVLNAMGAEVEKTIAVEIGNVASLDTAAQEMKVVASYNKRVDNPTLHYILSWPEHEVPKPKEIFEAARATLKALRMDDHQYIIAIHGNTDNIHAHIAVNRVHPLTYKAARIEWMHKTLHRAAREIEIEHGWTHDNGLFKVVELHGNKFVVPNTEYVDPDLANVKGGAAQFETWHGEQSLESWCRGEPAQHLRQVLDDKKINSWQAVHEVLAKFGLELRDSGGGGMRVHALDGTAQNDEEQPGKALSVSASKAFRFLKRDAAEARLGPFKPADRAAISHKPETSYKRDPQKRLERKLERKALRDALHARFVDEQKAARITHTIAKDAIKAEFSAEDEARREALRSDYRIRRAAIQADSTLSNQAKQQAYMLAKLTMVQARAQLEEQIKRERVERRSLMPSLPTWREWVEEQALTGDEAAISALRGLVYQEGRDRKKQAEVPEESAPDAIYHANPSITDPFVRKVANLVWKVHRNGNVAYSFDTGASGFIDAGDKLLFDRALVSDEALALTLQYAQDKWGTPLQIRGGDQTFKIRAAKLAASLGIDVDDPALKAIQREYTARRGPRQASTPAPRSEHGGASVEQQLRALSPVATIEHAITQAGKYNGKIVAQDGQYVAQAVDKDRFVLHDRQALGMSTPAVGKRATIAYKSGSATVTTTQGRTR